MSSSSERTVTTISSPNNSTSLTSTHHFVSLKLTHRNYLYWRTQVIPFLRGQGLLGFIDGTRSQPSPFLEIPAGDTPSGGVSTTENPAYATWVQQDASILSLLISSLSKEVMYLALGQTTARGVWTAAETALGSSTQVRYLNLLGQIQSLRQSDSSTSEYLGRAQHLVQDLALAGRLLTPSEQNLYVFRGLRPEFRAMASALAINGTPVSIPQLADYLQAQQFIHEDDFPTYSPAASAGNPSAMYAGRGRRQQGEGGRQSRGGGGRSNQRGGRSGRGRNGGGLRCQICSKQGHSAAFCYRRYSEPPPTAHMAVARGGSPSTASSAVTTWLPDTGASMHATPDSSVLTQSEEYHGDDVLRVGDGTGLAISRDCITKAVLLKGPSSGGLYSLSIPSAHYAFVSARATSLFPNYVPRVNLASLPDFL
ncbi:PREDICTED: uncharacterized protein LOC109177099 [Ipomoea nil]|uniref:uncharacterized protein LOC109177099 n=1 Tax=Ipomoea nil TaxID=35883 RepID=UPI000900DAAA|nr:PREDICTED: uncharacterized protein LOC109177099 [Ipomoea nil]